MSTNRENVTWLSPRDGLWYVGFFAFEYVNEDSPSFDPEWDVEYDMSRFETVTRTGRKTDEEAYERAVEGMSNPGGTTFVSDPGAGARCDRMADRLREECRKASGRG